jgi:IS5 family transposase
VLPDRFGVAVQGDPPDRGSRAADPGRGRRHADQGPGPQPLGREARARDRLEAGAARRAAPRGSAGHGGTGYRRARRAGRAGRCGRPAAAGQRAAGAAPCRGEASAAALAAAGGRDAAAGRRRGRLRRAVNDLAELLEATARVAAQTRQRLAGITPDGASRRVSLHDAGARPIAKGSLGKPVQFGYKGQVTDNDDGVVLDHALELGNPADAPQLAPAIERVIKRTGRKPRTVTADRGYGEKSVDDALHDMGVRAVVIPRKGKPGKARQAAEHRPAFRRTVKWRTGCEARISTLKRGYGWDRARLDNLEGARTWTGHGILAHNLVKIAALTT